MELKNFDVLVKRVTDSGKKFRVAVAVAGDSHTLEAAFLAADRGVIRPLLVGDKTVILEILGKMGKTVPDEDIFDYPETAEAVAKAVELVREGKADFLMKGKLDTSVLLKGVVNKDTGLNTGNLMSALFMAEIPGYHKLLAVVDGGMLTYPSLEQKKGLINNTVGVFRSLGVECPKVAVLACIEKVNPKMPETVDAAALKQMNLDGEIPNCIVEGPISYDCAMSKESAAQKNFESPVVGDCDILIMPNIHAANILSKALTVTFHANSAGFIVGAKCPVVISSRGSSPEEKFTSIVLAAATVLGNK